MGMKKMSFLWVILVILAAVFGCQPTAEPISPSPLPTEAATPSPTPTPIVIAVEPSLSPVPTAVNTEEPTPSPEPLILSGLVIGIDAGHQSHANSDREPIAPDLDETKSKVSGGTRGVVSRIAEYEVNLDVALILRDLLEASGATVVMVRTENDVDISNRERAELFNEVNVDLAVRLHCNGSDDPASRGAFMLVPDKEHTDWYDENLRAAACIINNYCQLTGLTMRGAADGITERHDQTGFNWCLRPIVNIEMGHMTNSEEDLLITEASFQQVMARGIYNGIVEYFTKGK